MSEKANEKKINKKMLDRLIIEHNLIKTGCFPNGEKLAEHYSYTTGEKRPSIATINRDIDYLKTYLHAPLEFDRYKGGYFYTDNFNLPFDTLSPEDAFYLFCVKKLLLNFKNTPLYNQIENVIDLVSIAQKTASLQFLDRIAVLPSPKCTVNSEIWKFVMDAIKTNSIIEFDYNGRWETKTSHRRVRPYQLLIDEGMYFLFGYDELAAGSKGGERIFSMNRIKFPRKTAETFALPLDFDFSSRCSGGRFGAFISGKTEEYEIEFYKSSRQFIKDCTWADDQKIEDDEKRKCTTIKFSSAQPLKILEWVLSQGENANPLKPEWLVEDWKNTIRNLAKRIEEL